jgi:outer membrane receptor protein involved in Fe transport
MANAIIEQRVPLTLLALAAACSAALAQEQPGQPAQPQSEVIDEVIAVGRLRSTALDVVEARLEQPVVTDFLGAAAIARVGDSTVSLALRRVPGVTLVNEQFIYVRGLGERYSSAQLNGAQVPSPDLTRNVIPLDIFPTEIIDALSVQKGYSPEVPAAFGGGNVNIVTRGVPNGPVVNIEVGSGMNSDSNDDGFTYPGGGDDSLGTDDGTRAFPDALTAGLQTYRGNIDPVNIFTTLNTDGNLHFFPEAEVVNRDLATSLNRDLDIAPKSLGPDAGLQVSLGNRWFLGDEDLWEFGALGVISYDNTWRNRERVLRSVAAPDTIGENRLRTINQVSATAVVNFGVNFMSDHQLSTSSFFLRNTEDESSIATRNTANFQRANGQQLRDYDIRFEERELTVNQLRGRHVIGQDTQDMLEFLDRDALDGLTFEWYVSDASAETDIPSEVKFSAEDRVDPITGDLLQTSIRQSNFAADYRFTELQDEVDSNGWDVMKPFVFEAADVELSIGQDVAQKARSYTQTEFGLGTTQGAAAPILIGTPGQVFTDDHILNPANGFVLHAGGIGTESYLAAQTNEAVYLKVDALLNEKWRLSGGARHEDFAQASLPIDTLRYDVNVGQCALVPCDAAALERIHFQETDTYPSLSVTRIFQDLWAEDFQLRFGVSETVARPDLREISQATYIDPLTEARVVGNADLTTSPITNFDVRAEWFFSNGDNFTASLFYKDIENPIETVQAAGSDENIVLTFINAESAEISGVEVEWLKDLSTVGPRFLAPFFFAGNLTLSDSELTVGNVAFNVTNDVRPMSQHSEYVANLQLGFDSENGAHAFTLVYNTFGERIFFAGRDGAPDAYEQPFDSLDFVYSFYPTDRVSLKFRVQNLLDEKLEIEQSGTTVLQQSVGTTAKIDVKWDLGG